MLNFWMHLQIKNDDHPILWWSLVLVSIFAAVGAFIAFWFDVPLWIGALFGVIQAGILMILLTQLHVYRSLVKRQEVQQEKTQAHAQILNLVTPRAPLPPMTQWAATPELALELIHQIMVYRPTNIVEFGSGCSSIVMGYILEKQKQQGRLLSIDHDEKYAEKTRFQIALHGLEDFVTVVDSPLKSQPTIGLGGKQTTWYSLEGLEIPESIDLLVVDGPPEKVTPCVRYPAVPVLKEKLSKHAVIVLHDTHRKDETAIIHAWKELLPEASVEWKRTDKGIAILTRNEKT